MDVKITNAINQGVGFLVKSQERDGSFLSYSAAGRKSFKHTKTYRCTFPSSLILSCLSNLEETPEIKLLKNRLAAFLLSQKSEQWSFNYWIRSAKESETQPYPDDLDDTFCALSALAQYNPELIDGSAMAKIVTLLTAVEEEEGGPYRTWLVPKTAEKVWKDVDLAVNSNVAFFLSLQDVSLPRIDSFIKSAIDANKYRSPYYPSSYPVIYFISRFYQGSKVRQVRDFLLSRCDTTYKWDNPLNTALAVSALLNFGFPSDKLERSISYLIARQQLGSWKPYAFCIDPAIGRKTYYAGSSALTTAFCLEALGKYYKETRSTKEQKSRGTEEQNVLIAEEGERLYDGVVGKAKERLSLLDGDLKKQALNLLEETLEKDKDRQIVLMPYFFKVSLGKNGRNVSNDMLIELCLANLYGWIAYTIYDDFLDDEGEPKLLSVANIGLRELTTIFNNVLPKETGFPSFFQQVMDMLDAANEWEVTHCRIGDKLKNLPDYGDYSKIAERSLGHALGPAAVLFYLGYDASSSELENLMSFFKHFLIARQLNDDAHDWEEDLKKGHINSVGALILKKQRSEASSLSQRCTGDIQNNHFELQKIFWYGVVVDVCQDVLKHVELARKFLGAFPLFTEVSLFEKLLVSIEHSAQKALREQKETIKFLEAY